MYEQGRVDSLHAVHILFKWSACLKDGPHTNHIWSTQDKM
jgi:hypothetical protein